MNKYGVEVSATIDIGPIMTETIAAALMMNTWEVIEAGFFTVVVTMAFIGWVIQKGKGKVEIELPKRRYDPGEKICGSVNLISRKELKIERFYVALTCHEIYLESHLDGEDDLSSIQIYRQEHDLAEAVTLGSGNNQRFEFSFLLPGGEDTQEMTELSKNIDGGIETVADVTSAMRKRHGMLEWALRAQADLPGVDISKVKRLRINKMS